MRQEKTFCDVCKEENPKHTGVRMDVIMTTEENEGKQVNPYLGSQTMDICEECMGKITQGKYIFGAGGQGHNSYWFKGYYDLK
jgi:hypothetical protein